MSNGIPSIVLPLLSSDDVPPPFDASKYIVPVIYPDRITEVDGGPNVDIDDSKLC